MRKPEWITFTGVDNRTDIMEMERLQKDYPVEWGVLFRLKRQNIDNRYPGMQKLNELCAIDLNYSAHLCGSYSRAIMNGERVILPIPLTSFVRFQINHVSPDIEAIKQFYYEHGRRCIAQTRGLEFPNEPMLHWLYDPSGGRGERPRIWPPHPGFERLVGYAGGVGPDNAAGVVSEINSTGPYWIDMESKVRTEDWLDLELCRKVCEAVYGEEKYEHQ